MAAGVVVPGWFNKGTTNRSAGLDAPPAKPAPEVGLTGCLEEGTAPGTFVLRNARQRPDDLPEKSSDYLVSQVVPLQLEGHMKHSVRLFGQVKEADPIPSDDSEVRLPILNASELRMASESCATSSEAEDPESYEDDASSSSGGRIRFADLASAGMSWGWPQMTGGVGQSAAKTDLTPELFAGISRGYRISQVTGQSSSQKINAVETDSPEIDPSEPTHGWIGSASGEGVPPGLPVALDHVPGSVGPSIALNAAAATLGVDLSDIGSAFTPVADPTPIPNPEPASLVLLGSALLSLAIAARRRHSRLP